MKKYIRTERANLFEPDVYISMVVKITGDVSKEAMRQAVERAYEANEATMSEIVLTEQGDAYYEKRRNSGCRTFIENKPWMELLWQSEKEAFHLKDGELVRVFLTEEDEKLVLFIHAHHLVGDGKSVLILLKDIVNALDGQRLTYKPMKLIERDFLQKKARLEAGMKPLLRRVNRKWKKTGRSFGWEDYYAVHKKYWLEHTSQICVQTYDINKIKAQCPKGITVNSYMITFLLRDYPTGKTVGIPVSIREEDGGMSNQTSGIVVKAKYNRKRSFEENLRTVHKRIYREIRSRNKKYFVLLFMEYLCPSLTDAVLLQTHGCYQNKLSEKMARIMGYMGEGGRDLGVTNLNQIDIPDKYSNFSIESIQFIPPSVSYTTNVIGISTFQDVLTVTRKMDGN
ncbi:MAG: condensation domain-containing protein [Clostridiales bacterium]|nr:condensation domain-containing protein [Clostridiales bacterium]